MPRQVAGGPTRDETAVAHDDYFTGGPFHLVKLVRDIDDGHAGLVEPAHQLEQRLGFPRREGGGGLVHDEQSGVPRQRLGYLDKLLFGDDQVANRRVRVLVQPHLRQYAGGIRPHRRVIEPPAALLLVAEEDVLRDGQVFGEVEFLVDQDDAGGFGIARVPERLRLAIHEQGAAGRLLIAAQYLHQRGLAGAVLAKQAVNTAARQLEAHAVQNPDIAEFLHDVLEAGRDAHSRQPREGAAQDVKTASPGRLPCSQPSDRGLTSV